MVLGSSRVLGSSTCPVILEVIEMIKRKRKFLNASVIIVLQNISGCTILLHKNIQNFSQTGNFSLEAPKGPLLQI